MGLSATFQTWLQVKAKCTFGAISGWNATLHSRVGRLFSCSAFLLYYVVSRSSQRWRQTCTQSIEVSKNENHLKLQSRNYLVLHMLQFLFVFSSSICNQMFLRENRPCVSCRRRTKYPTNYHLVFLQVVLIEGRFSGVLPLCSRNEPVFLSWCTPVAMPETRECVVQGATNIFTSIHSMDFKITSIDTK